MAEICIKKEKKGYVYNMHPWISKEAFVDLPSVNDKIIDIIDEKDKFIARGLYNKKSSIAVKILTYDKKENIDQKFFDKKIKLALSKRKGLEIYRAFNAEGDGIPGLIIDVVNDIVVYEIYSYALLSFEKMIIESIEKNIKPKYIAKIGRFIFRQLEGLDFFDLKWVKGKYKDNIIVEENNLKYCIDLNYNFGLQRENRNLLLNFAKDMNVLTLFCAKNGLIVSLKNSLPFKIISLDLNDFNDVLLSYDLNKFKKNKDIFLTGDVYKNLSKLVNNKDKFDLILIDYPNFIKSQKESIRYIRTIYEVLSLCISMLNNFGNIIFTTNSGFISSNDFFHIIYKSTNITKIRMQIFYRINQPYDYPSLSSMPESNFFNCVWMQKI